MNIQCTKKLLDELKLDDIYPNEEVLLDNESILSWHANFTKINDTEAIVLINNKTRYPIFLYNIYDTEIKNIAELITNAIKEVFQSEGIKQEIIEKYLKEAGPIVFTKTSSNTILGTLNTTVQDSWVFEDYFIENKIIQTRISKKMGSFIRKIGKSYDNPIVVLLDSLKNYAYDGKSVLKLDAYQLLIKLNLENHNIWRRAIVPVEYSFNKLNTIIQILFNWLGYHSYNFEIYQEDGLVNFICSNEEYTNLSAVIDSNISIDKEVYLSDYCTDNYNILYHYDLGDYWTHNIKVEKVIHDYPRKEAICLGGEGDRPPENVGGESGYEQYLKIISNKTHPDYEEIILWAELVKPRDFNLDEINRLLKRISPV